MALALYDRVQQTGTANTTVSFTLSGSVTGYQSFSVVGNGNTTYYGSTDTSGNWEVGIGTYSTTGPTLTRTTILSSSNSGSAVTFSGTVTVFVTYPSSTSVYEDASGNVSPLGTIASGTWNGSTIGVAYGGTGVTASSGANSVMLRDANQNVSINRLNQSTTTVTAAAGTTTLTVASTFSWVLTGTGGQTFKLPDATTLTNTTAFEFNNNATGTLTIVDNASGAVGTIASGGAAAIALLSNGTVAGTWDVHAYIPENVQWGTNSLALGSTVITGGTWNGGTIASGYGGTGLTTFSAANNALYSTSSSALAAGTLPVLAGGTGVTTSTGSGNTVLSTSPTLVTPVLGTPTSVNLTNATNVPVNQATGTLAIGNGGTGQTTAAAAFNALNPMTTTGDIIYEASASTAARLGIGSTGQVLTVAGGIPSWATPASGGGTITRTDFTATSGQTVFSVTYNVGLIDVYRNGIKLGQADFTATNGTSFTLAIGAITGDLIQAEVFSNLNLYSTITSETFNGTGSQTVFTMSAVPANAASLLVAISGVVQDPTTYSVSSNTLTFSTAPPSASGNISVRYLGIASVGTVGSFSAGTTGFTPSTATTGAITLAGTLNVANGGTGATSLAAANIAVTNATNTFTVDQSISGLTVGKGGGSVSTSTAVGYQAINATATGTNNTVVGYQAAYTNTSGDNIVAVGYQAAYTNATGTALTAIGNRAGRTYNTNGTEVAGSTFVGSNAGRFTTTGIDNAFLGALAGYANTTGTNNVAVGSQALQANTTASNNTAVGYQAGYSNTTAAANTFIGRSAGNAVTTGNENTLVGYFSGGSLTTGNKNTFIGGGQGNGSGGLITTGSSNTVIGSFSGNQGGLDIRTASNYIVLSDGDGNPRQVIDSSGNVGIGVTPTNNAYRAIDLGYAGNGLIGDAQNSLEVVSNLYLNGSWKYAGTGKAALLQVGGGAGAIYTNTVTSSGTAGNNVTFTGGPYVANGGSSWTNASDERLKNITGEISDALNKVSQLRAATYTWKADSENKPQVGLIAQDVQKVLPEVVNSNAFIMGNDTEYLGINYDQVIPLLVKAIQEQQALITSLTARIAALESK